MQPFSKCGSWKFGIPEFFPGILQGQNYFLNNSNLLFAFFIVLDIATDCAKAVVGKSDAIFAEIKTVAITYF